jgi:hypothetical protein
MFGVALLSALGALCGSICVVIGELGTKKDNFGKK